MEFRRFEEIREALKAGGSERSVCRNETERRDYHRTIDDIEAYKHSKAQRKAAKRGGAKEEEEIDLGDKESIRDELMKMGIKAALGKGRIDSKVWSKLMEVLDPQEFRDNVRDFTPQSYLDFVAPLIPSPADILLEFAEWCWKEEWSKQGGEGLVVRSQFLSKIEKFLETKTRES